MKKLVQKGLYAENLLKLIQACDRKFNSKPIVFHVLKGLFEKISRRYWSEESDAVSDSEVDHLNRTFIPAIISVLDASSRRQTEALEALVRCERKFFRQAGRVPVPRRRKRARPGAQH